MNSKEFEEIEKIYNDAPRRCVHSGDAVRKNEDGVYVLHCPNCGMHGFMGEDAARALGWIE